MYSIILLFFLYQEELFCLFARHLSIDILMTVDTHRIIGEFSCVRCHRLYSCSHWHPQSWQCHGKVYSERTVHIRLLAVRLQHMILGSTAQPERGEGHAIGASLAPSRDVNG